jgi:predicted Zn finger-like uncharacterized protein
MALATRCPHCQTAFRVASDQLKLRAGLVRCGTCQEIFNGIENLLHPDEDIAAAIAGSTPASTSASAQIDNAELLDTLSNDNQVNHRDQPEPILFDFGDPPTPTEDTDSWLAKSAILQPSEIEPSVISSDSLWAALDEVNPPPLVDAPGPEMASAIVSPLDASADVDDLTYLKKAPGTLPASGALDQIKTNDQHTQPQLLTRDPLTLSLADTSTSVSLETSQSAPHSPMPYVPGLLRAASVEDTRHTNNQPTKQLLKRRISKPIPPPVKIVEVDPDLPDFLVQDQRRQETHRIVRPLVWTTVIVLTCLLVLQSAYAMRTGLSASFPEVRHLMERSCRWFGCSVGLPMQIESVSIESSDFQPVVGKRDLFMLNVLVRNRGNTVQAWPALELSLNDSNDKTVGRRVILARQYLPESVLPSKGFNAASEYSIKLYLDLAGLKASGYHLYLFYP